MEYSIKFENGKFIETLCVDGHTASKIWKRDDTNFGLRSRDKYFSEQLEELLDEDQCNDIYNTFDTNMWVSDIEDFIMLSGVE